MELGKLCCAQLKVQWPLRKLVWNFQIVSSKLLHYSLVFDSTITAAATTTTTAAAAAAATAATTTITTTATTTTCCYNVCYRQHPAAANAAGLTAEQKTLLRLITGTQQHQPPLSARYARSMASCLCYFIAVNWSW